MKSLFLLISLSYISKSNTYEKCKQNGKDFDSVSKWISSLGVNDKNIFIESTDKYSMRYIKEIHAENNRKFFFISSQRSDAQNSDLPSKQSTKALLKVIHAAVLPHFSIVNFSCYLTHDQEWYLYIEPLNGAYILKRREFQGKSFIERIKIYKSFISNVQEMLNKGHIFTDLKFHHFIANTQKPEKGLLIAFHRLISMQEFVNLQKISPSTKGLIVNVVNRSNESRIIQRHYCKLLIDIILEEEESIRNASANNELPELFQKFLINIKEDSSIFSSLKELKLSLKTMTE